MDAEGDIHIRRTIMALVAYGSSDEDEEEDEVQATSTILPVQEGSSDHKEEQLQTLTQNGHVDDLSTTPVASSEHTAVVQAGSPSGPSIGPTMPSNIEYNLPDISEDSIADNDPPLSPHSRNRALLHSLTMPPIPNMSLPAVPEGSAPEKTNAKFAHFLKLKAQGVHFNEKLASSSALKNPSLFEKLMDFACIEEKEQWSTTLSKKYWDSDAFPAWAYKSELARRQKELEKESKEGRKAVDFVPASIHEKNGTESGRNSDVEHSSAAEKVTAGVVAGRASAPKVVAGVKRKSRFDN